MAAIVTLAIAFTGSVARPALPSLVAVVPARTVSPLLLAKRKNRVGRESDWEPTPQRSDLQPTPPAPAAALPPGWQEVVSAEGETFYFNAATGTSQWEAPATSAPVSMPVPLSSSSQAFDADSSSTSSRRAARRAARQGSATGEARGRGGTPMQPADDALYADATMTDAFIEDSSMALDLPSMSSFRAREATRARADTAPLANANFEDAPSVPKTSQEIARDRLMELLTFDTIDGPSAEMVDREPYDWTARLIGRGLPNKAGAYLLPYLQSGHMLLLGVLLLCSLISYPGFPLTEVPDAYRGLLLQGLGIVFAINSGTAVYARGIAAIKQEPVVFWMLKCLMFGGLALGELTQAVPDPAPPKKPLLGRKEVARRS